MAADPLKKEEAYNKRNRLKQEKPYVYEKVIKFEEKLKRGESIAIIQFQYNYTCNFTCVHCSVKKFQGKSNRRSFTMDDVKSLSRQADEMGLARFVITGGEPLVFKDFDALLERFFNYDDRVREMNEKDYCMLEGAVVEAICNCPQGIHTSLCKQKDED